LPKHRLSNYKDNQLIQHIVGRYLEDLERFMREVITNNLTDEPGYGVMVRYAMGWVNAENKPYDKITGKRLRPTLLLLCNEAAGGNWHDALPAASSVEILHNFSLIHDDIQDVSEIRHNRPTVWKVWGRNDAINAGDAMFALSYIAMSCLTETLPAERVLYAWQIFNQTNMELTRGQHLDMRFETLNEVSVDDYISMIKGKTAALLAACAQLGAWIATGDKELARLYHTFGSNIGIAFQIRDDILGIWGDTEVTGKSVATDIISRKKSLPVLYGLAATEQLVSIYQQETFTETDVFEAVELLDEVNAQSYAHEQEIIYYERAMNALKAAQPKEEAATILYEFVDFLFERNR
jgi:geranylgeranyl diphosphate synthase type I